MPTLTSKNITPHKVSVTRKRREQLNGHRSIVVWFTGLSGSGKSTVACAVEEQLHQAKCRTIMLDGDNIRHGLCTDLDFGAASRHENTRRISNVGKLFVQAGVITLTAFISPFRADRERAKQIIGSADFVEVYVQCPLEVCEKRDTKGIYKMARNGEINNLTGIGSAYEEPNSPDLTIHTDNETPTQSAAAVLQLLRQKQVY